MTTFKTLSAVFLTITLVSAGIVASVEAAPAGKRELRQAKRASALAVEQPRMVAQAAPAKAKKAKNKADRQERRAKRLARFDTDGNGKIDPAERLAKQKLRFAKLDANGDQAISLAELQEAKKQRRQQRAMRANKMGKQGKGPMHKQGKSQMHRKDKGKRMEGRFARLDSDNNGSVSWQEFSAAKQNRGFGHGRRGKRNARF